MSRENTGKLYEKSGVHSIRSRARSREPGARMNGRSRKGEERRAGREQGLREGHRGRWAPSAGPARSAESRTRAGGHARPEEALERI